VDLCPAFGDTQGVKRRAVPTLVSRTTTPAGARAEVFRLLWRVMTWNGGELMLGCSRCGRHAMLTARVGDTSLCCACALAAEVAGERVTREDTFDDVHRLEALGFLPPLTPLDEHAPSYAALVEWSHNRARVRAGARVSTVEESDDQTGDGPLGPHGEAATAADRV